MNDRKKQCKGMCLNYSIAVDKQTYDRVKKVRSHLSQFNHRHLSIGEVTCMLIYMGAESEYRHLEEEKKQSSPTAQVMNKVSGLLKELEEIVKIEKEKYCEQN